VLEERMVAAAARIEANRTAVVARLQEAQAGAETVFPRAGLTLTNPEPAEDLANALSQGRPRDMAAGRTLAGPHRSDLSAVFSAKGVAAAQCSTGEQKALLISLILANARALATDLGLAPVLLLDEVAAHLDTARRAALYDEIYALGAQAVMTGTEASLFDSLGPRAQCFEVTEADGRSQIVAKAL
jgi:DNA replication and repair protein RecF